MCKLKIRAAMNFLGTSESCEVTEMEPVRSCFFFFFNHPPLPQIEPDGALTTVFILYSNVPLAFTFRDMILF